MVRLEVHEYLRASAKLFGLAYEERAVTPAERAVIISFAQELERRFLPAREEDDPPLASTLSNLPPID